MKFSAVRYSISNFSSLFSGKVKKKEAVSENSFEGFPKLA